MNDLIFFSAIADAPVDLRAGIIRGVSVVTKGLAKGHDIDCDDETIRRIDALGRAQGRVALYVNHGADLKGHVGDLLNFRQDRDKVRADAHLFESHPDRAFVLEKASKSPNSFGLSIEFTPGSKDPSHPLKFAGGTTKLARPSALDAAAFVRNPAANSGLFGGGEAKVGGGDCFQIHSARADALAFTRRNPDGTSTVLELPAAPSDRFEELCVKFARDGHANPHGAARNADFQAFNEHMARLAEQNPMGTTIRY